MQAAPASPGAPIRRCGAATLSFWAGEVAGYQAGERTGPMVIPVSTVLEGGVLGQVAGGVVVELDAAVSIREQEDVAAGGGRGVEWDVVA